MFCRLLGKFLLKCLMLFNSSLSLLYNVLFCVSIFFHVFTAWWCSLMFIGSVFVMLCICRVFIV